MPHSLDRYTGVRAVAAEGARVGFCACRRCGATLVVDPGDRIDVFELHDDTHAEIDMARDRLDRIDALLDEMGARDE